MWDSAHQDAATARFFDILKEFNATYDGWLQALQTGQQTQGQVQTEDVLRRWRTELERLRAESDMLSANQDTLDRLSSYSTQVTEQREILRELRSKQITRADQADSLNPKTKATPYTNILGLQRIFRPATRTAIMIAGIVFAVIAIAVLGYIMYATLSGRVGVASGPSSGSTYVASGGMRR